jgi:hypothetical protein
MAGEDRRAVTAAWEVAFWEVCFAVRAARAAMGRRIESTEAMIVVIYCLEIDVSDGSPR